MRAINFFIAIPPTKPAGLLYSTKPWSPPSMSITVIPDTSPAIGSPFLIFFFKQNAYSFPKDTLEAARMDGLNEYQIFFKIFMPMMKSTYAAAGIFMFMASWNNYMWPLIALQSDTKFTLPLVVANLASGFTPDYGMTMVGIVLSTLPTIIVFFTLQKSFVEGMTGSVK